MKNLITLIAIVAATACGGGGGRSPPPLSQTSSISPVESSAATDSVESVSKSEIPLNTNCQFVAANHVDCDLTASILQLAQASPPGVYMTLTNRTGLYLQVDSVSSFTAEQGSWSEFCVYLNYFQTAQDIPGRGEVGCSAKAVGEDYTPITFGSGTGLSVAPGGIIYLASHTEPVGLNHTYSLSVRVQTTGLHVWRQPQVDQVFSCNGQMQSTATSAFRNETTQAINLTGVSIYSESGNPTDPKQLNGAACIYAITSSGAIKYQNCDSNLRKKGELSFPTVIIESGEWLAAQAVNSCAAPAHWGWAAFFEGFLIMIIQRNGAYLDRVGHTVGIVADRGPQQKWRWLTTRGYYVTVDGRASIAGGEVREDLVKDITPSVAQVAGMDSMLGALR